MMNSNQLRAKFLDYFKAQGHTIVRSSPLVPGNDPTLLFTNAGMVQFKDVFTGQDTRPYKRAASSQKCVRAGGKHNDLENVGYTARHHTFFEMLGNFSFGDYFKQDAIRFAWEFITGKDWLGIDKSRLLVTVYHTDDEAYDIWHTQMGVAKDRIVRIGDNKGAPYASDNFWAMGDTGPCGPCTEIFYDHDPDGSKGIYGGPPGSPEEDGDRWIEIWNVVFMQFNRAKDGTLTKLPAPSVDTGMGLERISALMQGSNDNYQTDTFRHLIGAVAKLAKQQPYENASQKVIADHIRATCFLITDGVMPGNEGRGYVLRRIMRRAIRHGYKLGLNEAFFYKLVAPLAEAMGDAYPELVDKRALLERTIAGEEDRFAETLRRGMRELDERTTEGHFVAAMLASKRGAKHSGDALQGSGYQFDSVIQDKGKELPILVAHIPGEERKLRERLIQAETLFEKGGSSFFKEFLVVVISDRTDEPLPSDIINLIKSDRVPIREVIRVKTSELQPFKVLDGSLVFQLYDTFGFPLDLTADIARERGLTIDEAGYEREMEAQRARARAASSFSADYSQSAAKVEAKTEFTGYELQGHAAKVLAIIRAGQPVEQLEAGEEAVVFLDRTPFYAESGGQVGDAGVLTAPGMRFGVSDTQALNPEARGHIGKLDTGRLRVGDNIKAEIDTARRDAIRRNHSATHLLHAALRSVLGTHVSQKGSLVSPARLRFDFSHDKPVSATEIESIENMVNAQVLANVAGEIRLSSYDEAVAAGAMALFGEKYGDVVRVLKFGEFSTELCGGTHVSRTGDIGLFKIVAESGVAAGIRRIEAVTGENSLALLRELDGRLREAAGLLRGGRDEVVEKTQGLLDKNKQLERELTQLKGKLASNTGGELAAQAQEIGGVKVLIAAIENAAGSDLRPLLDQLKNKLGSGIILLGAAAGEKVSLIAGVTADLTAKVKAGELVNVAALIVGGKGGGRPDMAQAGGNKPAELPAALDAARAWAGDKLKS